MVGVPTLDQDMDLTFHNGRAPLKRFLESSERKEDVRFNGAPFRFNDIMSYRRFQEILSVHRTYNTEYPPYKDRFHPVQDFLNAWNDSMDEKFMPS